MGDDPLRGQRILVVEDTPLHAKKFERMLKRVGAEVVGPATTLDAAEKLVAENGLSAALLDVRLNDNLRVWPVARVLARKGVPFLFCTAHPDDMELAEWPERRVLEKNAQPRQVLDALADLIAQPALRLRRRFPEE